MKTIGDVIATMGTITAGVSQMAQTITPILTFLIAIATLAWWVVRFAEYVRKRETGDPL